MNSYFRVYTNPDIVGVELGGALKNIIALAAGITDGLGLGDNAKAALMTRGLTRDCSFRKKNGWKSVNVCWSNWYGGLNCNLYQVSIAEIGVLGICLEKDTL